MAGCEQLVSKAEFDAFKQQITQQLQSKYGKGEEVKIVEAGIGGGEKTVMAWIAASIAAFFAEKLGWIKPAIDKVDNKAVDALNKSLKAESKSAEAFEKAAENYAWRKSVETKHGHELDKIFSIDSKAAAAQEKASEAFAKAQDATKEAGTAKQFALEVEKRRVGTHELAKEAKGVAGESKGLANKAYKLGQDAWEGLGKLATKFAPLLALLGLVGFVLDILQLLTVWAIINALESRIDQQDTYILGLEKTITNLYNNLYALKLANQALSAQIAALISELNAVKGSVSTAQSTANSADKTATLALNTANEISSSLGSQIEQAKSQIAQLKTALAAVIAQTAIAIGNLNGQIEQLKNQVLESAIAQSQAKAELYGLLAAIEGQIEILTQQIKVADYIAAGMQQKANQAYNLANQAYNLADKALNLAGSGNNNNGSGEAIAQLQGQLSALGGQVSSLGTQVTAVSNNPPPTPKDIYSDKQFLQFLDGKLIEFGNQDNIGNQIIDNLRQEINQQNFQLQKLDGTIVNFKQGTDGQLKEIGQYFKEQISTTNQTQQQQYQELKQNIQATNQTIDAKVEQVIDNKVDAKIKEKVEPKLQEIAKVDDKQYQDIVNTVKKQNEQLTQVLLFLSPLALLPLINNKTDKVLNQTNPSNQPKTPCLAPVYVPPVDAKVQQNINLTNGLQAATIAQNQVINGNIGKVQTIANTVNTKLGEQTLKGGIAGRIVGIYDRINGSKAMQYFSTVLLIHNAMMLSGNIANTIGYALDAIVSLTPFKSFKDENDNEIPFNKLFGNTIEGIFIKIFGKEKVKAFEAKYAASMRVYQSAANMLSTVRSMMDSARDIAETTNVNVGEIGNALRRDGVIQEDAYGEMSTTSGTRGRFIDKLQKLNTGVSAISSVSSDLVDVKEEFGELQEQRLEYQKSVADAKKLLSHENDKIKQDTEKLPSITEKDEEEGKE